MHDVSGRNKLGYDARRRLLFGLTSLGLSGLVLTMPARSQPAATPQAPFTIADPAKDRHAFSFDSSVTHPSASTIVPRLVGPEEKHESLHDGLTGAKIEEFGTAYSYANPLYGTNHTGTNGVGLQGGGGAGLPTLFKFVVARFGAPPQELPLIPGIDRSTTPPHVALIRYAMEADHTSFPDTASANVIDLAIHSMGRARITQLDIAVGDARLDAAGRDALLRLVALALVHQGAHPAAILSGGRRVLPPGRVERGSPVPGHVFSLVLLDGS